MRFMVIRWLRWCMQPPWFPERDTANKSRNEAFVRPSNPMWLCIIMTMNDYMKKKKNMFILNTIPHKPPVNCSCTKNVELTERWRVLAIVAGAGSWSSPQLSSSVMHLLHTLQCGNGMEGYASMLTLTPKKHSVRNHLDSHI